MWGSDVGHEMGLEMGLRCRGFREHMTCLVVERVADLGAFVFWLEKFPPYARIEKTRFLMPNFV